jgi:hypothetical protein
MPDSLTRKPMAMDVPSYAEFSDRTASRLRTSLSKLRLRLIRMEHSLHEPSPRFQLGSISLTAQESIRTQ